MEHPHGGLGPVQDASALPLVLRLVLLLATALVAGIALARPHLTAPSRRVWTVLGVAAALSTTLAVVSAATQGAHVLAAAAHVALVAAAALVPGRPTATRWIAVALTLLLVVETAAGRSGVEFAVDTAYVAASVAWFALTTLVLSGRGPSRAGPLAVAVGGALVVAGAVRLAASGVAFDRRLVDTALGLALVGVVVLPLAVTAFAAVTRKTERVYRVGGAGVVAAFVAWTALAAVPAPPELPVPGVPVLAEVSLAGQRVPVLISPHRPGRNLVHLPSGAGDRVEVAVAGGPAVPAAPRPGAEGTWAEVELPAGRAEVVVVRGGETGSVEVDPGDRPGPALAVGPDGPECAGAALGALLADRREVLAACPADALSTEDEEALRALVGFLGTRGAPGIALHGDDSPRGARAAQVVREAAGAAGLRVDQGPGTDNALVVVSGWSAAHAALSTAGALQAESPVYPYGLHVAPWLLNAPLATTVTTVSTPLRFDPREPLPVSYAVAVGERFGGESPSVAGFRAWLGDRAPSAADRVRLFAAAQVTVMPMGPGEAHGPGMPMSEELAGQWIPKSTVVPVSAPLLG